MVKSEEIMKVQSALGNPKFKYRTIRGIAQETKIFSEKVQEIVDFEIPNIVRSRYHNQFGEQLYTNRDRLKDRSIFSKVNAAVNNRAD